MELVLTDTPVLKTMSMGYVGEVYLAGICANHLVHWLIRR